MRASEERGFANETSVSSAAVGQPLAGLTPCADRLDESGALERVNVVIRTLARNPQSRGHGRGGPR
jgi:hypothetical protein